MTRINHITAREVFDSRGKPTVEVEMVCQGGALQRAIVPSGASTGQFEAHELRDGDPDRLDGTGVLNAVRNVIDEIAPALKGLDAADQAGIDARLCELDGTAEKSRLGANAILGVSLATAYAAAAAHGLRLVEHLMELWSRFPAATLPSAAARRTKGLGQGPLLPLPMVNMISGGLHAGRNLDFQDFLILPVGAETYRQALEWIVTIYRRLGTELSARGMEGVLVGDEGGYGPKLASNEAALEAILAAIEAAGLQPGNDVALGLDVASTHFYSDGRYHLAATGGESLDSQGLVDLLAAWVDKYPIMSIEDALADDDRSGWAIATERLGSRVQLIGDDLFVTNRARLEQGIADGLANSVLVKINQVGTLTETFAALRLALDAGYLPVISARSGETEDATIADLAVATGAGQIKIGSVARSERLAKYNQLLRLEEYFAHTPRVSRHSGVGAPYLGGRIFSSFS